MIWTKENLKIAQDILGKYTSYDYAHEQLQNAIGKFSKSSIRNAFHLAGLPSPTKHLLSMRTPEEMGPGKARTAAHVKPPSKVTRILIVSDLHVPYHDVRAWECVLETIRQTKPETVVLIGDFCDMYSISSHPKSLDRKVNFVEEVAAVNRELDALLLACGDGCRVVWTEGNHEDRITRFLQSSAPELGGITALRAEGLFRVKERDIEWVPYRRHIKIGNCAFTHDVGRCGINAARQSLLDFGGNIVFGHSHRGACVYQGEIKGSSHFGLNVGWLGDVEGVDYQHQARCRRDWQTGFGIVDQDSSGYSWGQFVPVIAGRCVVDGVQISGRKAA
jgi:predicted phosphodiesterase